MLAIETQIWKSSRLTIERARSQTHGTVFRLSGPFTARDMYSALSPDTLHDIFEWKIGDETTHSAHAAHIFDLTEVPYMDLIALDMLTSHYFNCKRKGIRLSITGVSPRVQERLRINRMENVLPIAAI